MVPSTQRTIVLLYLLKDVPLSKSLLDLQIGFQKMMNQVQMKSSFDSIFFKE